MRGEPVWERLRAPDHRPLEVAPVRTGEVDELQVLDGALPQHDGALVFDAWMDGPVAVIRAAVLDDHRVVPLELRARALRIEASDGRLEALLTGSGPVSTEGELERQACACRGPTVSSPWWNL